MSRADKTRSCHIEDLALFLDGDHRVAALQNGTESSSSSHRSSPRAADDPFDILLKQKSRVRSALPPGGDPLQPLSALDTDQLIDLSVPSPRGSPRGHVTSSYPAGYSDEAIREARAIERSQGKRSY